MNNTERKIDRTRAAVSMLVLATLGAGVLSRSGRWLNRGSALWLALLSVLLAARAMAG